MKKEFDRNVEMNKWYFRTRPNGLQVAIKNALLGFHDLRVYGSLGERFDVIVEQRYVFVREYRAHPSGGREVISVTRVGKRSKAAERFAKTNRREAQSWAGQMRGWYAPHVGVSS